MFGFQSYSGTETLPDTGQMDAGSSCQRDGILRVYSDIGQVQKFLKHPRFVIAADREEADIWWIKTHFKDYQ